MNNSESISKIEMRLIKMRWIFVGIMVFGLFGSLSRFTPNTIWSDTTYFFRKNKKDYLKFSNIFRGNYLLILGLISLIFSIISLFITIKIKDESIFILFIIYLVGAESILQLKWNSYLKHEM